MENDDKAKTWTDVADQVFGYVKETKVFKVANEAVAAKLAAEVRETTIRNAINGVINVGGFGRLIDLGGKSYPLHEVFEVAMREGAWRNSRSNARDNYQEITKTSVIGPFEDYDDMLGNRKARLVREVIRDLGSFVSVTDDEEDRTVTATITIVKP